MSIDREIVRVFVASPGDTKPEREVLADVVDELNQTIAEYYGIRVELIRYETHADPDVGDDAQDVINKQLPDFDVFVGILWSRFGTPTKRAGSGTEEEFDRALTLQGERSGGLPIMVYFKDEPLPPSKVDPGQLQKIQEFRTKVESTGCLHWPFASTDDFSKQVRIHLTRHLGRLRKSPPSSDRIRAGATSATSTNDDDEGFLDALEHGTEKMALAQSVLSRLTTSVEALGEKTSSYAQELNDLDESDEAARVAAAKQIINLSADTLSHYASHLAEEVPLLKSSYAQSLSSFGRAAVLLEDFGAPDTDELKLTERRMGGMQDSLDDATESILGLRESIAGIPRVTTRFNRAKRSAVEALSSLIEEMGIASRLTGQTRAMVKEVIDRLEASNA